MEEFVTKYGLLKHSKHPYKLRIPQDLIEENVRNVFGPTKGKNGRFGYTCARCKYEEFLHCIVEIFPFVYL